MYKGCDWIKGSRVKPKINKNLCQLEREDADGGGQLLCVSARLKWFSSTCPGQPGALTVTVPKCLGFKRASSWCPFVSATSDTDCSRQRTSGLLEIPHGEMFWKVQELIQDWPSRALTTSLPTYVPTSRTELLLEIKLYLLSARGCWISFLLYIIKRCLCAHTESPYHHIKLRETDPGFGISNTRQPCQALAVILR